MLEDRRNIGAGIIFIGIALFFGIDAVSHLELGSAARMGPGYFPLMVAIVLFVLGAAILAQSLRRVPSRIGSVAWRALPPVLIAPVVFGLTIRPLGMALALFITLIISFTASRETNWKVALAVSVGLTIFCVVVFIYALGLTIPVTGSLFES